MKLISIKKKGDKIYYLDGNSYFIAGLFMFLFVFGIGSIFTWSFYKGFMLALLAIFIIPAIMINDLIGKKKHKSILNSKFFRELYSDGFKREMFGEYHGVIKLYKNRTIRCYYDWSKYAKGFLSFGDIVLNIFYEPLVKDFEGFELNETRIKELNIKYEKNKSYGSKRYFTFDRIVIHLNYYPWTKYHTINKKIKNSISLIDIEGLEPFDIEAVPEEWKNHKNNGVFLPHMELIWKELDKNANKSY